MNIHIFGQPDTLIPNVYDPQSLNRYMFERGNPYKNVDPSGHMLVAVNPPVVLGVNNLGYVFGQTEAAYIPKAGPSSNPAEAVFKGGEVNDILRSSGYKSPSELPKGSWLKDLIGKFRAGGMGKMNSDGTADVVRWDLGHSGYEYPHMNHVKYGLENGMPKILGPLPLDHVGYFFIPMSFLPKSIQTDVAKTSSKSNSGGGSTGPPSGGSSKPDGTEIDGGGICGVNTSCL